MTYLMKPMKASIVLYFLQRVRGIGADAVQIRYSDESRSHQTIGFHLPDDDYHITNKK